MSTHSTICPEAQTHTEFMRLYPVFIRHSRDRGADEQEEAVAEAVASAFTSYVRLKDRGKNPVGDSLSAMATFAVLHVKDGRHVGAKNSRGDVRSGKTQQKHVFRVRPLSLSTRVASNPREEPLQETSPVRPFCNRSIVTVQDVAGAR